MPVSGAAGRIVMTTFWPQCSPTPWQPIADLKVRCCAIPMSPNM